MGHLYHLMGGDLSLNGWGIMVKWVGHSWPKWVGCYEKYAAVLFGNRLKKMLVSTTDYACTKQHPSTEPTEDTRVLTTINIT